MSEQNIIVAVAPVAHSGSVIPEGVVNPVSPEAIAAETVACAEAGASVVHLHVRDALGELTGDTALFSRTIDMIREHSPVLINGSTGGLSSLTLEERCVALEDARVSIASLNMGSSNVGETVYVNTLPEIRFWAERMRGKGVTPELEVFSPSMIDAGVTLRAEGLLPRHLRYNFCLGFPGALSGDVRNLAHLVAMLPEDASWGLIHDGMADLRLPAAALAMGCRVLRVGFEDSFYCRSGHPAADSVELVNALTAMIRAVGGTVAGQSEAEEYFRF